MPGDGFVTSGQWKNAAVLAVAIDAPRWAWLPPGIRDTFDPAAAAGVDADVRFAFGDPAKGAAGFRLTHRQALAAQAVALATGSHAPRAVAFGEVAPVAMMLGSAELLRAWMLGTLAGLASDDEHHARLRETLLAFLQTGGSYKTTAEQSVMIAIWGNGCTDRNPAGQGPDLLRRRPREPVSLVVDAHSDLRQGGRVLPVMMRAEQQLQAVGEQGPDVSLGAATVTAVHGGKPGNAPARHLAPLLPVSASGPEFASAQDDHLIRCQNPRHSSPPRGSRHYQSDGTGSAIAGHDGDHRKNGSALVAIQFLVVSEARRPAEGVQ